MGEDRITSKALQFGIKLQAQQKLAVCDRSRIVRLLPTAKSGKDVTREPAATKHRF